jgi:hypothetical protein
VKALWTAIASVTLLAIPSSATDAGTVLAVPKQRIETADFRVSGNLVRVNANGVRISVPITIKAHWFPGVLRVLLEVTSAPKSSSGSLMRARTPTNILLEMRPDGQNTIHIATPGDKAPVLLPSGWSDGPLGSGFSYEDFLEPQFFWPVQSLVEHVKYGARDCDQVTSEPGPDEHTNYAQIRTWLDHSIGFPVYEEKTLKASGAVKEFTYLGLRHDQGVWSANQIEARLRGQPGSTLLIIDRGSANAHLTATDFGTAQLMHF